MTHEDTESWSVRVGAASLGMFAGMALGLAFGCLSSSFARFVFGGAAAGALTGLLYPAAAMLIFEATVHFFFGFFSANVGLATDDADELPGRNASDQPWVAVAFTFGVAYAVALWLLL